ncbi:MAG: c-di-GMP-binding flagellar brake protein YcgR [Cognaticolwellia sp.]|jgi:c-di-GMP-binding flagellar brake protein YcgR
MLDFPREVRLQNLRSSMRIETYIKAKFKVKDEYWASVISDISVSGCQIIITNGEKLILTEDKPVEIIIEAFQDLKNLKLNAEICNTKTQVDGVKFDDLSKSEVRKLLQQAVILPH